MPGPCSFTDKVRQGTGGWLPTKGPSTSTEPQEEVPERGELEVITAPEVDQKAPSSTRVRATPLPPEVVKQSTTDEYSSRSKKFKERLSRCVPCRDSVQQEPSKNLPTSGKPEPLPGLWSRDDCNSLVYEVVSKIFREELDPLNVPLFQDLLAQLVDQVSEWNILVKPSRYKEVASAVYKDLCKGKKKDDVHHTPLAQRGFSSTVLEAIRFNLEVPLKKKCTLGTFLRSMCSVFCRGRDNTKEKAEPGSRCKLLRDTLSRCVPCRGSVQQEPFDGAESEDEQPRARPLTSRLCSGGVLKASSPASASKNLFSASPSGRLVVVQPKISSPSIQAATAEVREILLAKAMNLSGEEERSLSHERIQAASTRGGERSGGGGQGQREHGGRRTGAEHEREHRMICVEIRGRENGQGEGRGREGRQGGTGERPEDVSTDFLRRMMRVDRPEDEGIQFMRRIVRGERLEDGEILHISRIVRPENQGGQIMRGDRLEHEGMQFMRRIVRGERPEDGGDRL